MRPPTNREGATPVKKGGGATDQPLQGGFGVIATGTASLPKPSSPDGRGTPPHASHRGTVQRGGSAAQAPGIQVLPMCPVYRAVYVPGRTVGTVPVLFPLPPPLLPASPPRRRVSACRFSARSRDFNSPAHPSRIAETKTARVHERPGQSAHTLYYSLRVTTLNDMPSGHRHRRPSRA